MKKSILITVVVALIAAGVGFYGGMLYQQKKDVSQRGQRAAQFGFGAGGPGGTGTRRGAGNGAGGFVSGQIISQDSQGITVKSNDGSSKIVLVSGSAQISKFDPGTSTDLQIGKDVTVMGTTNSDGSVTAQNIQIRPNPPAQPQQQ
jgi:hypothetical protein